MKFRNHVTVPSIYLKWWQQNKPVLKTSVWAAYTWGLGFFLYRGFEMIGYKWESWRNQPNDKKLITLTFKVNGADLFYASVVLIGYFN